MESNAIKEISRRLRKQVLSIYHKANAGHIGCSLSCLDLIIHIFYQHKRNKDTFILSKGHAAVALYTVLHSRGSLSDEQINSFYYDGTQLPAHPAPNVISEIPFATGSLGHGLPYANGVALSAKLQHKDERVFVLMSDGESNEGTTWEAAHFAVQHKLDNLIVLIDRNEIQGFGRTEDVLGDTAAKDKWQSIGFNVVEIDGHRHEEISTALQESSCKDSKPKLIIANTLKGKGVSYMENTIDWHYWPMSNEQYQQAINEIEKSNE